MEARSVPPPPERCHGFTRLRLRHSGAVRANPFGFVCNVKVAPDLGMLRLILGNLMHLGDIAVCAVDLLFEALQRLHHVADGARAEDTREDRNLTHAPAWTRSNRRMFTKRNEFRLPDRGVTTLTRRNGFKRGFSLRVFLQHGEPVIEVDRIAL